MPLTGSGMVGHMASMIYGYAKISTNDQTTSLQKDALEKAGCDRIFTDVASGAKAHRPELDHMLDFLREARLDRVGCFAYSPVEGAQANRLPGALPDEVREERRNRFMEVQAEISA